MKKDYLKKQIGFIKVRDLIVSPGHCLIKKTSIPEYWTKHVMSVNSADDYFLWLLMIENKCQFNVNYDVLYTHKYTTSLLSKISIIILVPIPLFLYSSSRYISSNNLA